jgi:gas vesicle protein
MSVTDGRGGRDGDWLPVVAFIGGVLAGAALATLFAPASGRETRQRLATEAQRARRRVERSVYARKLEFELESWAAQLDALAASAGNASADARRNIEERLTELRGRMQGAREMLERLRASRGPAWREVAAGAERAWQELRTAVEGAASAPR